MPSSQRIYDIIHREVRNRPDKTPMAKFPIHPDDKFDLMKIKISDLTGRGYSEGQAAMIVAAMMQFNLEPFGRSLGVEIVISDDVKSLFFN